MKYRVLNLIGALAGLVVGSFLVPPAIFAGLTPLHVTWDSSQCPSGEYTVTTTATNTASGEAFQASARINLPAGTIGQDFPDLPSGTYVLAARADGPDGRSFLSPSQTLTVGASAPPPTDDPLAGARRRPSTTTSAGTAQPRSTGETSQGGANSRSTGEPIAAELSDSSGGQTKTLTRAEIETEISLASALETVARIAGGGHGGGRTPGRVQVIDEDGDGAIDSVTITIGRVVRTWRVSNR